MGPTGKKSSLFPGGSPKGLSLQLLAATLALAVAANGSISDAHPEPGERGAQGGGGERGARESGGGHASYFGTPGCSAPFPHAGSQRPEASRQSPDLTPECHTHPADLGSGPNVITCVPTRQRQEGERRKRDHEAAGNQAPRIWTKGPRVRECRRRPPAAGNGKGTESPPDPPKGTQPCQHPEIRTSDPHSCKIMIP